MLTYRSAKEMFGQVVRVGDTVDVIENGHVTVVSAVVTRVTRNPYHTGSDMHLTLDNGRQPEARKCRKMPQLVKEG